MKTTAALASLLVLTGCSTAEPAEPETVTETTTATVEATPATEYVTHVPSECLDALGYADRVQELANDVIGIAADGFGSVQRGDADGVNQTAEDIEAMTPDMTDAVVDYRMARDDCRDQS